MQPQDDLVISPNPFLHLHHERIQYMVVGIRIRIRNYVYITRVHIVFIGIAFIVGKRGNRTFVADK